jgi:hypothetical protein
MRGCFRTRRMPMTRREALRSFAMLALALAVPSTVAAIGEVRRVYEARRVRVFMGGVEIRGFASGAMVEIGGGDG